MNFEKFRPKIFYATCNYLIILLSTDEPNTTEKATTNDATIAAVKTPHADGKLSKSNYNRFKISSHINYSSFDNFLN